MPVVRHDGPCKPTDLCEHCRVAETDPVMTITVQVWVDGRWEDENYFPTRALARRYIRNCRYWDGLRRRIKETTT